MPRRAKFQPIFVEHRGRRILRVDYSGMSLSQALAAMPKSMAVIASQPRESVLVLTRWDVPLTQEAAEAIRQHVVVNTPHIRASAVVTPRPMQRVFFESLTVAGRKRLEIFDDEQQALDWLVSQEDAKQR